MKPGSSVRLAPIKLAAGSFPRMRTLIHSGADGLLLEVELPSQHDEMATFDLFARFEAASSRLRAVGDVLTICHRLAEEVRRLTGYDRVKIYRFAADWSGEVIAEDGSGGLPSYLGLCFPASDIPQQARLLYTRNLERQIPDIGYRPVKLLQSGPEPLDLSLIGLRTVSANHLAYLKDMAVGASMSISILRHGALWGMIACHHHTAYYVPPELRQASVLLAQLAAWQLTVAEEGEFVRRRIDVKAIEADLLRAAGDGQDYRDGLQRNSAALLGLMQAGGMVLSAGGAAIFTLGETPGEASLNGLLAWLTARGPDIFETEHLASHYPPAASLPEAAGVLAVPLDGSADKLMVWFRPEIRRTVTWSGNPGQAAPLPTGQELAQASSRPQRSFAAWSEEVRLRSRPWTIHERAAAAGLRDMIVDIIARRAMELERLNDVLTRKNDDLEAFSYVAAHDLREPLRQIQTFGTLLERAFRRASNPTENVTRWFEGLQSSAQRLRGLINDLAVYSRVGLDAKPLVPVALDQMLTDVLIDFAQPIEDLAARIEADPLPTLLCDPTQMRQAMQNLISNALKYHHPDRPPIIRIVVETLAAEPPAQPVLKLAFADNGIGFDERHRHRIFDPFERLHSSDVYEGSGLGLAICRKIVDRHGGSMSAESRLGEGSVFTLTLPMRPLTANRTP